MKIMKFMRVSDLQKTYNYNANNNDIWIVYQ